MILDLKMAYKDLNSSIDFWEVTKITDDAAEVLSKGQGKLWLGGLTELSDAAAECLSKHKGELHLNSLTQLSNSA
jgi:hypothetical protein